MSYAEQNTKPANRDEAALELSFELKWRTSGKSSAKRVDDKVSIGIWDTPDDSSTPLDVNSFRTYLWANVGVSGNDRISYMDSDGDELPIDSQSEFLEALKFARARAKKDRNVFLLIDRVEGDENRSRKSIPKDIASSSESDCLFKTKPSSTASKNMAPITVNEIVERVSDVTLSERSNNAAPLMSMSNEPSPPLWFKNYMEMLKKDIITEVSTKVMANVTEVLNKRTLNPCLTCYQRSELRSRHSRDSYLEEKQQRRKKKRVVEAVESSDALPSSEQQDNQLSRKVKRIEKRERKLETELDHPLERLVQKTRLILEKKKRCREFSAMLKNWNKPADRKEEEIRNIESSATEEPLIGRYVETIALPVFDTPDGGGNPATSSSKKPESKSRMNCSITGNEMLDKPNIKDMEYHSDSNSDNISIISDASHTFDFEQDHNFEMIPMPSCIVAKSASSYDFNDPTASEKLDNTSRLTPRHCGNNLNTASCEEESDRNNNRDSPSFELLSEPSSPALLIYMDEDHFHTNENDIDTCAPNADLINFASDDANLKNSASYVVDAQGKIFRKNILNEPAECIDVSLDKRPGGAYSYVNETLPNQPAKETCNASRSEVHREQETSDDKRCYSGHSTRANKSDNVSESHCTVDFQTNLGDDSYASTQSFSSHTTSSATATATVINGAHASADAHTSTHYNARPYTFVDLNVNKGLGETKYSSKNNLDGATREPGTSKARPSEPSGRHHRRDGRASTSGFSAKRPRRSEFGETAGSRKSSSDRKFGPARPVHISPETLVGPAMQAACSAYTTMFRVFEKIYNV